jgi:predicted  nucleic acid-binding Zn-ribbon protein
MKTIILAVGLIFLFNTSAIELHSQVNLKEMRKKEKDRRKKLKLTTEPGERSVEKIASTKERYGFTQIITRGDTEAEEGKTEKRGIRIREKRDPMKTKEYWQDRKKSLENQIAELDTKIKMGESQINQLVTQYYNMGMAFQQNQIRQRIDSMLKEIEADKVKLQGLREKLEELSNEARKAGVPAGWVR